METNDFRVTLDDQLVATITWDANHGHGAKNEPGRKSQNTDGSHCALRNRDYRWAGFKGLKSAS